MKRLLIIISILLCLVAGCLPAPAQDVSKKTSPGDTLNLVFKMTKEESKAQQQINFMMENSAKTNEVLSKSIQSLTKAVETGIEQSRMTKIDIVAKQMGVTPQVLQKAFKRNNLILLICLLPVLAFIMYSMLQFMKTKGLNIKDLLAGTAVMALYSVLGGGVLYFVLSIIFNQQYFMIKSLLSAQF